MVTIFIQGGNHTNLIINSKYQAIWTILSHKKSILHLSCFCSTPTVTNFFFSIPPSFIPSIHHLHLFTLQALWIFPIFSVWFLALKFFYHPSLSCFLPLSSFLFRYVRSSVCPFDRNSGKPPGFFHYYFFFLFQLSFSLHPFSFFLLSCFLPSFVSSFLPSYFPSFLSSYLPSFLISVHPFFSIFQ